MYADEVKASFDGSNINGEMAMNEEGATVQKFAATRVEAPAGMYPAARGNSRATWIVRPNNTTVGVMDNSAPGDHKVTDATPQKTRHSRTACGRSGRTGSSSRPRSCRWTPWRPT
jgi:hypothetical protein